MARSASKVGAVLGAVAIGAAACGGSSAPPTTTTTFDSAAAPAAIAASYQTLFNFSDKSLTDKVAVIQNGTEVQSSLQDALSSSLSSSTSGAKIDSTTILHGSACTQQKLTSPCAKVTYDLVGATGASVLANQTGYADYDNGRWLVAKVTICQLLGLFYTASGKTGTPQGCSI